MTQKHCGKFHRPSTENVTDRRQTDGRAMTYSKHLVMRVCCHLASTDENFFHRDISAAVGKHKYIGVD